MITKQANELLQEYNASCLIFKNEELIYSSSYIGVKPLILFLKEHDSIAKGEKLLLVDKVIGRAAALLAAKIGIKTIITPIMSQEALEVVDYYDIHCQASKMVPYIINRQGIDRCPLEASVINTLDLDEAVRNIQNAIDILMKKFS